MLNRKRRRGFSLIELLIVVAIILIIITMAVPQYNKAQRFARETAAITAIRTLHQMQVQYQSQYGRFAATLAELGPPPSGADTPAAAGLIGSDLSNGEKGGYKFAMVGGPGGYSINANPIVYGSSGNRSFFSDQSMIIRENYGPEPASVNSKPMP